ncbi:sigma-70 family RNA polymerase sigma factor [Streptomyces sp. NPDC060187]|uniref:sigma-70 family RNA polymerase sigma factor n=1 Tax=Streptomyces sp. NPDC060187 TaxID=3347067 RepID=UPI00365E2A0F
MNDAGDAVPIAELLEERQHLLDVAYWMLGSGSEAEWVVTEAYRRWYELPGEAQNSIAAPRAWLAKTAGSLCLTRLAVANRREVRRSQELSAELADDASTLEAELSEVLLDALNSLSPVERAAFVLADVFGVPVGAIADIVGQSEGECSQLADRARRSLQERRSRPTAPEQHDTIVRAVRKACANQDAHLLACLLSDDATAFFDGGGKVRALSRPVHGNDQVARSLLTLLSECPRSALDLRPVNGRTGIVVRYNRRVAAVISLDVADHRAVQVWVVLNPDKLRSWNQAGKN